MEKLFISIFDYDLGSITFLIILFISFILGVCLSLFSKYKSTSSKNFFIAVTLVPVCTATIVMLVNGNIGAGVAVLGAFSLVRFRSAQGNAREIAIIFISMTMGFVMGMGYIAYAVLLTIFMIIILFVMNRYDIFKEKNESRILKITIPETLDYKAIFNDIFDKYVSEITLIRSKTTNMGSLYVLSYNVVLKNDEDEKKFIDELRCRNGNLEIVIERNLIEDQAF